MKSKWLIRVYLGLVICVLGALTLPAIARPRCDGPNPPPICGGDIHNPQP